MISVTVSGMMGSVQVTLVTLLFCSFLLGAVRCNNNRPMFEFGTTPKYASESAASGTELFMITATDVDSDNLTITTGDADTDNLVALELLAQSGHEREARVLLKSRLDVDRNRIITPDLWFKVSDGQTEVLNKVRLVIRGVNDNPPFLEHLPYRLELPERTNKVNSSVYNFSASDPDGGPGSTVIFSMTAQAQDVDEIYNTTFVIRDPRSGKVWLERELDYETRTFYQYRVFAKDLGNPQCPGDKCYCNNFTEPDVACEGLPATFTVTVKDVQDSPPRFLGLPYITQLYENATVGTPVLTVSAIDGDREVPNQVNYTMKDEDKYPFSMNSQSGEITVSAPGLDADKPDGRSYFITIVATEIEREGQIQYGETTATTQVSITVLDVNNNGPQFGQDVYYATVQENTPVGVPITINTTVTVTDKDQNTNSQFRLSVERDGVPYPAFSTLPSTDTTIQGSTTVMISVSDSSLLDYEQRHNISFQIYANETETSEKFSNFTTIILSILDMNDNSPYFPENQTTLVNVTEHSTNGTLLATLTATDKDSGAYGTIAYSLEDNFGGRFGIGENSGNLTVLGDLDRDAGDERFPLVVVAKDYVGAAEDSQRRSTRYMLQVTVLDTNDNAPVFQYHLPRVAVQENTEINTTLLTLRATDIDQGGNGEVNYSFVSISPPAQAPLFNIGETTGEVFVSASLTGHPGLYNVTFRASDNGVKQRLSAETSVLIDVRDVNENPPKFVVPDEDLLNTTAGQVPSVTIFEEQEIGTFILQLNASDADTEQNGEVHYYLDPDLSSAFLRFQVDPMSGNLSIRARLDADEGTDMYQINLRAQDQGTPLSLSSVIPFRVYLKDIDDNAPEFAQGEPLDLSVKEQASNVTVGFVNISTDKDRDPENRIACYYLSGGEKASSFQVSKTTGELRLLTQLDRLQTQQAQLEVKVTRNCTLEENHFTSSSNGTDSRENVGDKSVLEVRVKVLDVNNHPPVFDQDALTVGLLYDVAVGTEVINLATYTSDEDTAEYSKHMYRLLKFQGSNPTTDQSLQSTFSVSINGSVVTRRLFRADETGDFILTVQAYDVDNLTDIAKLNIYLVSNLQRVRLIFNKDPNEVNKIKGEMVRKLSEILKMTIVADKIATHITLDGTPDPKRTDVFIHGRYIPSGEIVPTSELVNAFDYNQRVFEIFREYGVAYVSPLEKAKEDSKEDDERKVFIIAIIVLVIVCVTAFLVLFTSVRRYRRRLRAATTSAFVSSKSIPDNHIPPGTNRYYTSENPLFGKDVKPDDFHRIEDKDTDSLDENAVDGDIRHESREEEPEEEQEMCMDMYDDDASPKAPRNPLAMVLHEYDTQNTDAKPSNGTPAVSRLTSPMAASMLGSGPDGWKPPLIHHVKPYTNNAFDHDLDDLQHTDL